MPNLIFFEKNKCQLQNKVYPCAYGKDGTVVNKREGDGGTPIGTFPLRQVFYRPDRLLKPITALQTIPLNPTMGWCDDSEDPSYNCLVNLPYGARHELLWRSDHIYDIILVIGYNDELRIPYQGSAIFIHLARENFQATEGCLAFKLMDLYEILSCLTPKSTVTIKPCF